MIQPCPRSHSFRSDTNGVTACVDCGLDADVYYGRTPWSRSSPPAASDEDRFRDEYLTVVGTSFCGAARGAEGALYSDLLKDFRQWREECNGPALGFPANSPVPSYAQWIRKWMDCRASGKWTRPIHSAAKPERYPADTPPAGMEFVTSGPVLPNFVCCYKETRNAQWGKFWNHEKNEAPTVERNRDLSFARPIDLAQIPKPIVPKPRNVCSSHPDAIPAEMGMVGRHMTYACPKCVMETGPGGIVEVAKDDGRVDWISVTPRSPDAETIAKARKMEEFLNSQRGKKMLASAPKVSPDPYTGRLPFSEAEIARQQASADNHSGKPFTVGPGLAMRQTVRGCRRCRIRRFGSHCNGCGDPVSSFDLRDGETGW